MSYKFLSLINPLFIYTLLFSKILSEKLDTSKINSVLLSQHNKYRKMHGVPELILDNELIKLASDYSAALAYKEDKYAVSPSGSQNKKKENLGENIYTCTSILKPYCYDIESTKPVDEWYNEIKYYNFSEPGFSLDTARFTQLIWKETTKMGCGASVKDDGVTFKVVCNYYKPGNVINKKKFEENVLPNQGIYLINRGYFFSIIFILILFL